MKIISRNVTGIQLGGGTYRVRFWEISQFGLLIALFFCAFAACKKPQNNPVYLNADFKSHFNYQQGTYWVMYDSVSGHTDSLYVEDNINYPPFSTANASAEENIMLLGHKDVAIDSILFFWNITLEAPSFLLFQILNDNLFTNDYTLVSGFPIITNNYCILLPNYTDNNILYNDVYNIIIDDNSNNMHMIIYYSVAKGFITIMFNQLPGAPFATRSLHLLRSNIVIH